MPIARTLRGLAPALAAALSLLPGAAGRAATLELHAVRRSGTDLEVRGAMAGLAPGASAYVGYDALRALPVTRLRISDEFVKGEQEVTVVFVADLWKALPVLPGADCLLATCNDRYASVFRADFIAGYRPFVVLEINGQRPEKWSAAGLADDPGPYAITVSARLVPAAARYLSIAHKKPWGVVSLEFASYAEKFHDAYSGAWAGISPRAAAGRDIWINACACCHPGPGGTYSGTKSHQVFPIVAAVAKGDPDLFRRYVRAPTSVNPAAKMEEHPYFTDAQLDAVMAFIRAEKP